MKRKNLIKLIAVIISVSVIFTSLTAGGYYTFADETTTSGTGASETTKSKTEVQKELEQQRAEFEANINFLDEKLEALASESKETEEYINTLDEKIGYLNKQLTILDNQITDFLEDIDALQKEIEENQAKADALQAEVDAVQKKLDELNEKFKARYEAYCIRMRAIYMYGQYNVITALLTSEDISSFLTRYEMIRSISKSDASLMQDIEAQTEKILEEESDLNEKKATLSKMNAGLLLQKNNLQSKQSKLTTAQNDAAKKKIKLSEDRAESDKLFAELTAQNGMYTEFRNEDEAIKEAVEAEINAVINGIKNPEDVTLATTSDRSDVSTTSHKFADIYSNSDAVLNMTYPVPNYYSVSAGFPNYSNGSYHGGIDFPCPTGTKVVAAQSGVVSLVKRLDYSYGYYVMIYHGTDANGEHVFTLYAHNSSILVSPGDTVSKGQQIAKSGSTGNSTGPHCHFEVRMGGTKVNPKNYLSK
ncbi:MAG: peptidoglycan DD-metalloendopeptidase family protein [Eubacterium sp.]|nr:peptidoglycan DD-metalloendopeptidase family protein [Eubacterium sp.]